MIRIFKDLFVFYFANVNKKYKNPHIYNKKILLKHLTTLNLPNLHIKQVGANSIKCHLVIGFYLTLNNLSNN